MRRRQGDESERNGEQDLYQSFSDAPLMSQAAQTMIAAGADMLTGTSQAVVGAIAVVKDKKLAWFGKQSEQTKLAPKNVVATQVYDCGCLLSSR